MRSRESRSLTLACCLLVCLTVVIASGTGIVASGDTTASIGDDGTVGSQDGSYAVQQDQPEPDNTLTRIKLASNGSAVWRITFRTRLTTEEERTEYERFQDAFRENETRYLDPFRDRMTGVVANANGSIDREMHATAFDAETSIQEVPRRWGVVTFRFRWDGFATVEGDDLIAGDVFEGGFYIDEDDVLVVTPPEGYRITTAEPAPDEIADGSVEWHGREDFSDRRPRVVATPAAASGPETGGDLEPATDRWPPLLLIAVLGVGVVALLGVVFVVRSGRFTRPGGIGGEQGNESPDAEVGSDDDGSSDDAIVDRDESAAASVGPPQEQSTDEDPALRTDEDRVRQLLTDHGGRTKQSAVVEELGWSKSKTSRVLSRMAEEGTVEKLRIGRENVIDLNDEES
ncbi:helix-turn-helix transcriptional regulator [Halopenitus sp. H-Gu1]|uniref:helix-turn-helix transcriptional regulator n=1 Tax=Halopenitus sp. H-Gu1 TaxID=3242697 RepID=UPI00359DA672